MTMTDDLAFASLKEHGRLLRCGRVSARELAESCLRRIESIDDQLGAFEVVDGDRAWRQADSAQAALMGTGDTRPLVGVPVAVKADSDIAGNVTTHGGDANRRPARQSAAGQDRLLRGRPSLRERVAALGIPVRVIWGAAERLWPVEAAEGHLGLHDVQVFRLEGVGPTPMIEAPVQTAELIEAFAALPDSGHGNGTAAPRATEVAQ
jgi:pimeloyl-ACP methyl ester carboxylesterase